MAGETYSLDFTQPEPGQDESDTPLYPGYQIVHLGDERGTFAYQVRRVVQHVTAMDARRGIAPAFHLYPKRHETLEEALAAAKGHFEADGPGDHGGNYK